MSARILEGTGDPRLLARLLLPPRFGGDGVSVRRHAGSRAPRGQVCSRPTGGWGRKGAAKGTGASPGPRGPQVSQQPANASVRYYHRLACARAAGRALPSRCSGCFSSKRRMWPRIPTKGTVRLLSAPQFCSSSLLSKKLFENIENHLLSF